MKIEKARDILKRSAMNYWSYFDEGGEKFTFLDLSDAIDQRHKELMELVNKWRSIGHTEDADELEALINPKA